MFYLIINSIYHLNMKTYVDWDITRLLGSGAIHVRGGPVEHLFMGLLVVWRCKSLAHFLLGHLHHVWTSLCLNPSESRYQSSRECPSPPMVSSWSAWEVGHAL